MRKISTTILLLLCLSSTVTARQRSAEEKTAIAMRLLGSTATRSGGNAEATLRTLATAEGYTVLGRTTGGFAIVSNDDANKPVVGYSETSTFDASQPSLAWYLNAANDVLTSGAAKVTTRTSIPTDCKKSVATLMKSKWSQDDPYWNQCPTVGNKYCYTGCVATAMAQVMYYYKYPSKGMGEPASVKVNGRDYTVNFKSATYDWNSMMDTYTYGGNYSVAQKKAIGQIMYHCGVAVDMNYTTTGSGASLWDVPDAMTNHFGYITKYYGYKENTYEKYKYDFDKWNQTVYRELSAGHPIIYAAVSNKQGNDHTSNHAFVLDGYDENGYVHVNWGYGGQGDGTFDINVLQLKIQGSYDEEYRWYQQMVVVHHPDAGKINYDLERISTGINSVGTANDDAPDTPVRVYDTTGRLIHTATVATFNPANVNARGVVVVRQGSRAKKIVLR